MGGHAETAGPGDYQRAMIVPTGLSVLAAITGLAAIKITRRVSS